MNERIGMIYGETVGELFCFVADSYINDRYVYYKSSKDENKKAICEITERLVKNKYLESPSSFRFFDDKIDYKKENVYTYNARVINVITGDKISSEGIPALPGEAVYSVSVEDLYISFGIKSQGTIIGTMAGMPNSLLRLDNEQLFSPHLFVVGKTGSGKSYFIKHIMESFDSPFWIVSPNGEYNYLKSQGASVVDNIVLKYSLDDIVSFSELNLSEEMILKKINIEEEEFVDYKSIKKCLLDYYGTKKASPDGQMYFDYNGKAKISEEKGDNIEIPRYADSLLTKIKRIKNIRFTKNDKQVTHIIGEKCVFDLSRYNQREQECIISSILFKLRVVEESRLNKKKNLAEGRKYVLFEEAHNYAPSTTNTFCKQSIVKMAREGRKLGISLGFITQRPRYFDQTVISQAGTKVIFALSNAEDITHITDEMSYYSSGIIPRIQAQRTGECMIASGGLNNIIDCRVKCNIDGEELWENQEY